MNTEPHEPFEKCHVSLLVSCIINSLLKSNHQEHNMLMILWSCSFLQGDIHKKEKSNTELKEKINEMTSGSNKVNLRHKEEINSIEEETRKINVNIQVGS